MTRDDASGAATVIVAFVLGAITGAAVALLVAPSSGEEMRRRIGERAREGKDSLSSAVDRGRQAYQQAREGGTTAAPASAPGEPL